MKIQLADVLGGVRVRAGRGGREIKDQKVTLTDAEPPGGNDRQMEAGARA